MACPRQFGRLVSTLASALIRRLTHDGGRRETFLAICDFCHLREKKKKRNLGGNNLVSIYRQFSVDFLFCSTTVLNIQKMATDQEGYPVHGRLEDSPLRSYAGQT